MNKKATFVFISTLEHLPWGGCEDLWYKTAMHAALSQNQKVFAIVFRHEKMPPHLQSLSEKGATILFLDRNVGKSTLVKRLKNKLAPGKQHKVIFQNLSREIANENQVHVLVSQAGGFDFAYAYMDSVRNWLLQKRKFHVVVQNVPDLGFTLPLEKAKCQQEIFDNALSVGFVSERNQFSAERILATKIPTGYQINNPLNFNSTPENILWPSIKSTIRFAEVAALRCFHKGQDILLQVLSGDLWQQRDWELHLYGTGPDEKYLSKLVDFYDLKNKVFFHGHVSDIKVVWQNNHIHILPSLGEGTPLALIESMICSRPVVTTDVGGNATYITDMQNGFIADYPTLPALQKVMERAWQNIDLWEEMGQKARTKILNDYDLESPKKLYQILSNETAVI